MDALIHCRCSARRQAGLSLVELMISITLGLIILAAVATLFVNQNRTRSDLDKANRLIENGRYALEVLSENVRLAGFYGEFDPSSVALPVSVPDPCATAAADLTAAIRMHVQGYDASGVAATISTPPCSLDSSTLKAGSDILVLRRASTADAVAAGSAVAGTPYLQVSLCVNDASGYRIDTVPANFTLRQRNCTATSTTPYADLRPYIVQVYFISPNNVGSDGIPTLKRLELTSAGTFSTVALVEGIEYMQIDYGIDDTGDGVPDVYVANPAAYVPAALPPTCTALGAPCNWSNVMTVKISLLARNVDTTAGHDDGKTYNLGLDGTAGPFHDTYKRHIYSQVVRLVNPSSRREAP